MNLIDLSMAIAVEAYSGKVDKAGEPYILHPLRMMMKFKEEGLKVVALLHDVIEDSQITPAYLINHGIPLELTKIILLLSKRKDQSYEDYIHKIKKDIDARIIKIADIEDNINILRLHSLGPTDIARIKKYHAAWRILNNE